LAVLLYGNISSAIEVTVGKGVGSVKLDSHDLDKIAKFSADWTGITYHKCNHTPDQKRSFIIITDDNIKSEFTQDFSQITHNCLYGKRISDDSINVHNANAYGFSLIWAHKKKHPNLKGTLKLTKIGTTESRNYYVKIWGSDKEGGGNTSLHIDIGDHPEFFSDKAQNNDILAVVFDGFNIKHIDKVPHN